MKQNLAASGTFGVNTSPRSNGIRRVAVVTGTRAEYGLLRSTMQAITEQNRLQLQIVATGTHLLEKFGHTINEITADGWTVDAAIPMQHGDDSPLDQAEGLSRGVAGIAAFLQTNGSDAVVVLGDRIEAMAGALAGLTTGRLVAHIHGGDLAPGDFDDSIRNAITQLAQLHFPATKHSARRIIRMGASPDRVHVVGAPGLDRLVELIHAPNDAQGTRPNKVLRRQALIVHHPCGRAPDHEKKVMRGILRATEKVGLNALCVYPNSDRGHSGIVEAIEEHRALTDSIRFDVVRSLSHDDFLRALIHADVLIGNSSAGIIEAATAGTAVVNIGPRQTGREQSGPAIVHSRESYDAVKSAISAALRKRTKPGLRTVYGDGYAGQRIANRLAEYPYTTRPKPVVLYDAGKEKLDPYKRRAAPRKVVGAV